MAIGCRRSAGLLAVTVLCAALNRIPVAAITSILNLVALGTAGYDAAMTTRMDDHIYRRAAPAWAHHPRNAGEPAGVRSIAIR